jgi:ribosomal protein S25
MRIERLTARPDDVMPALTRTALTFGALDQQLRRHPLREAVLFRVRLEAARQCAAVDGFLIDPWQLAASLEGLRPRIRGQDVYERGSEVDALRYAFEQYQWLVRASALQEERIAEALSSMTLPVGRLGVLWGSALAFREWIERGDARAPFRGALVRLWQKEKVFSGLYPVTGAAAFRGRTSWEERSWIPTWLDALEREAAGIRDMVHTLERSWRDARAQAGNQRRHSKAALAIDVIAAYPVISATTLAAKLSVSVQAAYVLLERFVERGLVVDVTRRSARRLFALKNFAPLRESVRKPRKPLPGRKRGRPRANEIMDPQEDDVIEDVILQPLPRWQPDFSELEAAMKAVDILGSGPINLLN